jgi:hypothetical protein
MKRVIIDPVLNGFLVTVGCSQVVSMNIDHLCSELKRYQANPELVEKEYMEWAINRPNRPQVAPGSATNMEIPGPEAARNDAPMTAATRRLEMPAPDRNSGYPID